MRRDHRYRYAGCVGLHPFHEFEAIAIREAHVGQADIEIVLSEQRLGAGNVHCRFRANVHAAERERQQLTNVRLVINNQS